jgi:signal transduction histidine kinase/DNA-binding response OmpR family regulator
MWRHQGAAARRPRHVVAGNGRADAACRNPSTIAASAMNEADGAPSTDAGAATAQPMPSMPVILVAAGDPGLRDGTARLLRARYLVETARDAADALAAARRRLPDLVLYERAIRDGDGVGLAGLLRGDPGLRDVPVIAMSNRADEPDGGPEDDVDDHLYRPFSPPELLHRVAVNLAWARSRRDAARREAELRAEADAIIRRIEIVLTHLPFGLTMVAPGGKVIYSNPARERLLRFRGQPKVGDRLAEQLPAFHADGTPLAVEEYPIRRALRGEIVTDLEIRYEGGDGPPRWLRSSGIPVPGADGSVQYAISVAVDMTGEKQARLELLKLTETLEERVRTEIDERLKAEETVRQMQKLQAIGQLTGGVAHDFNNLLQVMLGNLDAVERQLDGDAKLDRARMHRQVAAALRSAERAAQLTQQLLAFSRRQPLDPSQIDVNALMLGMTDLLRRTLGETVLVETIVDPDLKLAFADRNQLESALLNLAVNARDAMPQGGRLTIETANCSLDEASANVWEEFSVGDYVMIAVSDTGSGIPADILPHVFEPFFTTKDVGHGTGLGLSQAYGFAKQSGGHIKIYSEVGVGTTVKLFLPAHARPGSPLQREEPAPARGDAHGELILVVEDDPDVRAFSGEMLRELGYRVVEAVSADEAVRHLEQQPGIRLMFTDIGLPGGMTGRQLADEATRRWPDLKVLFTTGYARNAIVHNGRLDPGVELITKPFTANGLAAKIADLLQPE